MADKPKNIAAQVDFSAGEVDSDIKRGDLGDDNIAGALRRGARQMVNFRILNTKKLKNRPGRRALFLESGRVDEVLMAPGIKFFICFGAGTLRVYDSTGVQKFTQSGFAWNTATAKNVGWTQSTFTDKKIWITFPGQVPKILTWDGAATWSVADFSFAVIGNTIRGPFYRISPKGITLTPSGTVGNINLTFLNPDSTPANVLVAGMINTLIRYQGREIFITGVTDGAHGTGAVQEPLSGSSQRLTFGSVSGSFNVGDFVSETNGGLGQALATGTVTGFNAGAKTLDVTIISRRFVAGTIFQVSNGAGAIGSSVASVIDQGPAASTVWDQSIMNAYWGWPQSIFFDQNRLGFCNFPGVPGAIVWSAEAAFDDFYPDAFANDGLSTDAIFEIAPNKSQVLYVVPGAESNEFVFCDNRIYWIPISIANPLKPGSIAFNQISTDGAAAVQPRQVEETILYLNNGSVKIKAVIATGSYTRPYETGDLTNLHTHLLNSPIAIAIPTADGTYSERYAYVLNGDGSIMVGMIQIAQGAVRGIPGWWKWNGGGTPSWISTLGADVVFTTTYAPPVLGLGGVAGGAPIGTLAPVSLIEILDDTRYLDASQLYNTQPAGLPKPGGKGPLWYLASGSVDLMDGPLGTRPMGTYSIDTNGFLIPQNNAGEDFTSPNLVVGQTYNLTLEPFVPAVSAGQDVGQRLWPRRVQRLQVYVTGSSGFVMQRLYSDQTGANLPPPGTVMSQRRIPAWNIDENPTQPPTLREQSYLFRPLGRSHDPRLLILKDTPGPLTVLEAAIEVTL